MKILMLIEYFTPFDFGGSEWSTYYLAKGLAQDGFDITILTPNYGNAPSSEKIDGVNIVRPPFYKKLKEKKQLSPFWQSNILWIIWSSFFVARHCFKNKIDVIHVQGKYFLPSAIIPKIILHKKVVVTLRDYIVLCPLGMCLLKDRRVCGLFHYFTQDLPMFLKIYHKNKNILLKLFIILSSVRARIVSYLLKLLLAFADVKIVLSRLQKNIYKHAGIKRVQIIGNPIEAKAGHFIRKNQVVCAGRLTPGKGVDLLIETVVGVLKKYPNLSFVFYGDGFLKIYLKKRAKKLGVLSKVTFRGYINHQRLLVEIKRSQLAIIPSVWPEPFGRIVAEALVVRTPVVVSSNVGAAGFIKDRFWGRIVTPKVCNLDSAINWAMANINNLQKNLSDDQKEIREIFSDRIYDSYAKIYRSLIQ